MICPTFCRSVISLQFSSSWPSPLVNLLPAVTLSLIKLSMLSSKPAFPISPKSQINNLKICASLSRRKCRAGVTCLAGWREEPSWAAPSSPAIWVGSRHSPRRGWLCHSLSLWGRGWQEEECSLKESSVPIPNGEITKHTNLNDASFSYRVNSALVSISLAGYCFPAQCHDPILCKVFSL